MLDRIVARIALGLFQWLEGRSYKMHIRVLLSKYRSYTPCADCGGARLKPEALLWRLGESAANGREIDGFAELAQRYVAAAARVTTPGWWTR